MRILIIGATGQVACALSERAAAHGDRSMALGRPEFDIADHECVAAALRRASPDVVINAAAYTAVDLAESHEEAAAAVNAVGAGAVARAAAEMNVPLVHISTDYVFDGRGDTAFDEDAETNPLSAYGRTKLSGEHEVAAAHANSATLRTAWVFSPFGRNFVRTMLARARAGQGLRIVADQVGSPTYALDLADALLTVARNLIAHPEAKAMRGVFHAANAGFASWADLAVATFEASARRGGPVVQVTRIATADYPTPAVRPANSRLDTDRLRRVHGVSMRPWTDALDECVARLLKDEGDAA